jgi:hypothetical protein
MANTVEGDSKRLDTTKEIIRRLLMFISYPVMILLLYSSTGPPVHACQSACLHPGGGRPDGP